MSHTVTFPPGPAQQHGCRLHILVSEFLLALEAALTSPLMSPLMSPQISPLMSPLMRNLLGRALSSTGSPKFPSQPEHREQPKGWEGNIRRDVPCPAAQRMGTDRSPVPICFPVQEPLTLSPRVVPLRQFLINILSQAVDRKLSWHCVALVWHQL